MVLAEFGHLGADLRVWCPRCGVSASVLVWGCTSGQSPNPWRVATRPSGIPSTSHTVLGSIDSTSFLTVRGRLEFQLRILFSFRKSDTLPFGWQLLRFCLKRHFNCSCSCSRDHGAAALAGSPAALRRNPARAALARRRIVVPLSIRAAVAEARPAVAPTRT